MPEGSRIQFLKNIEIDKHLWDNCIDQCDNSLIYAKSFYLDNICNGWNALVGQNYDWLVPITYKTKLGISYLYQPPFTQQLGIFAKAGVLPPYKEIIDWLKQHYKFWEVNWNYSTDVAFITPPVHFGQATNFILDLSANYESISNNYHRDLTKNLKRSKQFNLVYKKTNNYDKYIELYRRFYGSRMPHVKEEDYENFSRICSYAFKFEMVICREATNNSGELMAVALLLFDGRRLYNIMNTTTEAGRKKEANHFLLDNIIKEFSGENLLLDFEGSDLPGVKAFYANFGAVNQPYFTIKYNQLPWPLRLFKK
jgi:hypothetical protein